MNTAFIAMSLCTLLWKIPAEKRVCSPIMMKYPTMEECVKRAQFFNDPNGSFKIKRKWVDGEQLYESTMQEPVKCKLISEKK